MITPRIEPVAFAMLGKCIYHCASWPHQDWKYKWGLTCFWCSSRMHKLKAFTVANELPALIRNELSSLKSMSPCIVLILIKLYLQSSQFEFIILIWIDSHQLFFHLSCINMFI